MMTRRFVAGADGTLHRLIARLDEPCPAALARKEAAKLREESCPSRLLVEIGHPSPAVHEMPDPPLDEAATETLLAELDAATSTSTHPLLVEEPAPAAVAGKSWTRSVALPLFVLAAAIGRCSSVARPARAGRQRDVRLRGAIAGRRRSPRLRRRPPRRCASSQGAHPAAADERVDAPRRVVPRGARAGRPGSLPFYGRAPTVARPRAV